MDVKYCIFKSLQTHEQTVLLPLYGTAKCQRKRLQNLRRLRYELTAIRWFCSHVHVKQEIWKKKHRGGKLLIAGPR